MMGVVNKVFLIIFGTILNSCVPVAY